MGETKVGSTSGDSSKPSSAKLVTDGDRKLLKVELRQGDTAYVSWKKLMKELSKGNYPSACPPIPNANPNLESRIAPKKMVDTCDVSCFQNWIRSAFLMRY